MSDVGLFVGDRYYRSQFSNGLSSYLVFQQEGVTYADPLFPGGTVYSGSAAIQNAFTALLSTGGKVLVKRASYSISSTLLMNGVVDLIMEQGTILNDNIPAGNSPILNIDQSSLSVAQGLPYGKQMITGGVVQIRNPGNIGIQIKDIAVNGIYCDTAVENYVTSGAVPIGINLLGQSFGARIESALTSGLLGNANYGYGVVVNSTGLGSPNQAQINGCRNIIGWARGIDLESASNLQISNNIIQTNTVGLYMNFPSVNVHHNYFEANTTYDFQTVRDGMLGLINIHENGFTTTPLYTLGATVQSLNKIHISRNDGLNPIGKITNPFGTGGVTRSVSPLGTASAPIASTDYWIIGCDMLVTSTGGTGVSITVKDPPGNTVASGLTTLTGFWIPVNYIVNFGAFSVAPTVTVFGN